MKLLYDGTGQIYYSVYDRDWFSFTHTTPFALTEYNIDEIDSTNKELCADLYKVGLYTIVDINGDNKYYIDGDGDLAIRENWEEHIENPYG